MEFKARYAVTGLFAIVVVLAIFGFVYWLENRGGLGERVEYQVRFNVPVSGLANGSNVLFNGLKVGEVTAVRFDPARPESIIAVISVARSAPIREDSVAGIDYQGLTGAANILLTGGSSEAAMLAERQGGIREIEADPTASRSWTQNAGRVLGRLDEMLGRNTGRFDAILAGLERMTGGGKEEGGAIIYDLPAAQPAPAQQAPAWQLALGEPSVLLSLNTDKIMEQPEQGTLRPVGEARWTDNLPNLMQAKLLQTFENAGYTDAVLRTLDAGDPDYRLVIDIRAFHLATAGEPSAQIDLVVRLMDRDGAVVASRRFTEETPAEGTRPDQAAQALGKVFAAAASGIVAWAVATLAG